MLLILDNWTLTARMAGHALAYFGHRRWRRRTSPLPRHACRVPADFLGLCVANMPDSDGDDYIIARLNELGLRHVRLDFTYGDREAFTERFLDRLLAGGFRVCLHLVQPREEAHAMLRNPETAERWRTFVGDILDRYGSRMELVEIGSTCNRRKWSGYSPAAFFAVWQIAWEEARGRNLAIAGPNVTDFEPIYNAGWLREMRRAGVLPGVHTDNLFVERAMEPEAFDHKIAGRRLAGLLGFNLVRKAQLLQNIGAWAGVPVLICTHVAWSLRRIARLTEDVEEKQADYLARYVCLAAASGALARVYWGPLIGQREGLIDDGTTEYPEIPHVTYYEQSRGKIEDYRLRPAFRTFQTVNRLLAGAAFRRRLATGAGLEILEFEGNAECRRQKAEGRSQRSEVRGQAEKAGDQTMAVGGRQPARNAVHPPATPARSDCGLGSAAGGSEIENPAQSGTSRKLAARCAPSTILHAVWTTDGNGADANTCYPPELLAQAEIYSRDGRRLERAPRIFSESPVFLLWTDQRTEDRGQRTEDSLSKKEDRGLQPSCLPGFRFARRPGWEFAVLCPDSGKTGLAGVYLAEDGGERTDIRALLEMLGRRKADDGRRTTEDSNPQSTILRAARNLVWSTDAPWNAKRAIVIKAFKPRGFWRRFLDIGKPDKARRSWNGAQELLRRGLATPKPLACLAPEKRGLLSAATSYYVCEAFSPAWPVRDVFNAFSAGAAEFQKRAAVGWYAALALFLQKLHTRGVYFRDLSAGNLLGRLTPAGELEFALIDTARARFYPHSLGLRLRLCDLMRICHPLDWPNRQIFVEKYLAHSGRRFRWWMKIPFCYYDTKHRLKNALKGKRAA